MLVAEDASTLSPDETPPKLLRRVDLYIGETLEASGDLAITKRRVVFSPSPPPSAAGDAAPVAGSPFSLYYQAIVMHAVSRDTTSFHSPCIYLQLDAGHRIASRHPHASNGSGGGGSGGGSAAAIASDDAMDVEDDEEEEDDDEEDEEAQEVRLVPVDFAAAGDASMNAALDGLFEALSECAALNPDPGDDDGDDDDAFFDGAIMSGGMGEVEDGEDGGAVLLDGATPEQLAMLARYDAMLEASGGFGDDGRFDDAEADHEPSSTKAP